MKLLIDIANDYKACDNRTDKYAIEKEWMSCRNTLLRDARSCAESLDILLAIADAHTRQSGSPRIDPRSQPGTASPGRAGSRPA
jgi:hypothetical protein